jgi:hypothetical protein
MVYTSIFAPTRSSIRALHHGWILLLGVGLAVPLFGARPVSGQDPAPTGPTVVVPAPSELLLRVELIDGSVLVGRIRDVDPAGITLETTGGARITLERAQLRSITEARGTERDGEYWPEDPNGTRLFFTSTGRSLSKGEGYVGTYFIALPFVAFGLTDRITVAAGAPILFGALEPVYVAPKVQLLRQDRVEVSLGTIAVLVDGDAIGIAYGVSTFGSRDSALTLGVGFGFAGDDFSSEPVGMLGGELRLSGRVKLITENYVLPESVGVLYSAGLRLIGGSLSTDLGIGGLATSVDDDGGDCCLPIINFSYAFGRGR